MFIGQPQKVGSTVSDVIKNREKARAARPDPDGRANMQPTNPFLLARRCPSIPP
jgi:hypothetical protein